MDRQALPTGRRSALKRAVCVAFQLFRAQEQYPDLNMQVAIPAMICLLRGETVWRKFLAELKKG